MVLVNFCPNAIILSQVEQSCAEVWRMVLHESMGNCLIRKGFPCSSLEDGKHSFVKHELCRLAGCLTWSRAFQVSGDHAGPAVKPILLGDSGEEWEKDDESGARVSNKEDGYERDTVKLADVERGGGHGPGAQCKPGFCGERSRSSGTFDRSGEDRPWRHVRTD